MSNENEFKRNNVLTELRENRGYSTRELADKLGMSKSTISALETGRIKPSEGTLKILADFYNVSIDYILGRQVNALTKANLTDNQINEILENTKFLVDIKKKGMHLLNLMLKEDDINQVITLIIYLLSQEGIEYDEELKKKYLGNKNNG